MTTIAHRLPPGKYYVGDPQRVFSSESWNTILRATDYFRRDLPTLIRGRTIWGLNTATDRRVFTDQNGVEYQTIVGVLGAVPIELIENPEGEEHGTVIDAPAGMLVGYDEGVFRFDDIIIDVNEPDTTFGELGGDPSGYTLDPDDDKFI
jgi:hypothetical protein